jgi:hypothetical protein
MTFYVGQKVVCVNDGESPHTPGKKFTRTEAVFKGEIYTITSVHNFRGHMCFWLLEVSRSRAAKDFYGEMVGYGAWRFRPAVEPKTDISALREIVADVFHGRKVTA